MSRGEFVPVLKMRSRTKESLQAKRAEYTGMGENRMQNYREAIARHIMWFGSYTRSGELKKVQVWCFLHNGNIEFLTPGDSYKAKRVRRNPEVLCFLGSENGPAVKGTAILISDPQELSRGYRAYRKTHPLPMLLIGYMLRRRIKSGRQVLVRVQPAAPNPFERMSDAA
jgi:hypothetical protein